MTRANSGELIYLFNQDFYKITDIRKGYIHYKLVMMQSIGPNEYLCYFKKPHKITQEDYRTPKNIGSTGKFILKDNLISTHKKWVTSRPDIFLYPRKYRLCDVYYAEEEEAKSKYPEHFL